MQKLLDTLVARLPARAQRWAKALVPLANATAVAAGDLVISGPEWRQLAIEAGGVVTSLLVYQVRNKA